MNTENIIKSAILKLFNEGKSENEVYREIPKSYTSSNVSQKLVSKWFEDFKSGDNSLNNKVATGSKKKLTDEQIIDLVNKNPDLSTEKLARLVKCSNVTIMNRINKLNSSGESVNYIKKSRKKITDKDLIDLININPDLSAEKLSRLGGCSTKAVYLRIKKLNSECESVNYHRKDNFKFTDEYLIELVDKNPGLNMMGLAKLAGASQNTISRRIKQIKSMSKNINYIFKDSASHRSEANAASSSKLTDEYLINLINENPDLSIEKLAALASISRSTMWNRIKKINRNGERVVYRKKDNRKFTNEQLTNWIIENPELSIGNLATLADASYQPVYARIKCISNSGEGVNYRKKDNKKFTDEHLIDLINSNPDLNMRELATLTNTSNSAIYNRIKNIINSGERVNYISKKPKVKTKITDEFLIDLVNENPELNMKELAKLADTSPSTISKRIKKINSNGERVKYTKKFRDKSKV